MIPLLYKRKNPCEGFTLIEVLLALGLMSVILIAVYSLLIAGANGWKRMRDRAELYQTARVVFQKLDDDFQNSLVISKGHWEGKFPIQGEATSISFPTLLEATDPDSAADLPDHPVVAVITYVWKPAPTGTGNSLERDWKLLVPESAPNYPVSGHDVFPPSISNISFAYAYRSAPGIVWTNSWDQPRQLPQGIRVDLTVTDPDTGEPINLSKTISVWHGVLEDLPRG